MHLNRLTLLGYLGKDPETKTLPSGTQVTTFSVATTETWKDQQGQKQSHTEWTDVQAYGKLAELTSRLLKKGDGVLVEGAKRTDEFTSGSEKKRKVYLRLDTFQKTDRQDD